MVNIGEMMNKAIMDGMLQAIIIFMPYIISFLTTALVVWVIKKIIEKIKGTKNTDIQNNDENG